MSEDEIIKYAKIFSSARGDTYKINFVNEDKTIDEVEIWKGILKLIDKKDEVIKLLADRIFKECKHKCKSVNDIIDLAFDVVENVEKEND